MHIARMHHYMTLNYMTKKWVMPAAALLSYQGVIAWLSTAQRFVGMDVGTIV